VLDPQGFLVCPRSKRPMERSGKAHISPCGFTYQDGDFRVNVDFSTVWAAGQDAYEEWGHQYRKDHDTNPARMSTVDASFRPVYEQIKLDGLVLDVASDIGTVLTQAAVDPARYLEFDTAKGGTRSLERSWSSVQSGIKALKDHPRLYNMASQAKAKLTRHHDHHIFHPSYDSVCRLIRSSGFALRREVWPEAYHNVVFLEAQKRQSLLSSLP
jgi:hypothetical protein